MAAAFCRPPMASAKPASGAKPGRIEATSAVAQSRTIYMNVEAYRTAGPVEGRRFLNALNSGVDYLLKYFRDPVNGGFFWTVGPRTTR